MSTPLLATKLCIPPPRADRVPRPRLVKLLNAGLVPESAAPADAPSAAGFARRLTLVSAPAGFGKTTLVADWLAASGLPRAWLTLDEGDNDPARFFAYLLTAFQQVDAGIGLPAMALLQSPQPPPPQALLTSLANDVAAFPQPFFLVLDDYHLIHSMPVHQVVAALLEHLPPPPGGVHLVIVSREDPPLPLSRLRAGGLMTDIRQRDLGFSVGETGGFLRQVMGLELSEEDVATLHKRTEGWIAGLQLAALSLQRCDDVGQLVADFSGSHRYVLDYLAEEVFRRQSPAMQDFLIQTSILDNLTASLCQAVTGRDDAREVLLALDQANLFVVRLDESRQWYRYHRLFRDLLRIQGEGLDRAPLHRRAARWYAEQGALEEAMNHTLASSDWDEAERLVTPAAALALNQGRYATVGRWLDAMPEDRVRASATLATLRGWILLPLGQFDAAETWAQLAAGNLEPGAPALSRALVTVLQLLIAHARHEVSRVIELAQQAMDLLEAGDPYGLRGPALANLASAQMSQGDITGAVQSFRQMARLAEEAGHLMSLVSAWSSLAWIHALQNEPGEALHLCQQAIERAVGPRGNPLPLAGLAHNILGTIAYERNDLVPAREHLTLGVELSRQMGPTSRALRAAYLLAWILALAGDNDAAAAISSGARQALAGVDIPLVQALVAACEAGLALRLGDVEAAARWAEAAGLSPGASPELAREGEQITFARLLLAQERPAEALQVLDSLDAYATARGIWRSRLTILILRSLAQRALDRSEEAIASLAEAVQLAAPPGYVRPFLDEGLGVRSMLPRVRRAAPSFVDHLLEAFADQAGQTPARAGSPAAYALVEPLSEREFEVLGLLAEGLTNREIADRLFVTVGTVKTHVHNVYGKLGVHRRTEAVARAQELELL